MTVENILPCPFCGGEAVFEMIPAHKHTFSGMPSVGDTWTIECSDCPAGFCGETKDEITALWNARHCYGCVEARVLPNQHRSSPPPTALPVSASGKFIRAWLRLKKLPGGMMQGSAGLFGPVGASDSCWLTTSEDEAKRWDESECLEVRVVENKPHHEPPKTQVYTGGEVSSDAHVGPGAGANQSVIGTTHGPEFSDETTNG